MQKSSCWRERAILSLAERANLYLQGDIILQSRSFAVCDASSNLILNWEVVKTALGKTK